MAIFHPSWEIWGLTSLRSPIVPWSPSPRRSQFKSLSSVKCETQLLFNIHMNLEETLVFNFSSSWELNIFLIFRNLLMPLRASNLSYNDLRHVVILGNLEFLRRWDHKILQRIISSTIIIKKDLITIIIHVLKHRTCAEQNFSFMWLNYNNFSGNGIC